MTRSLLPSLAFALPLFVACGGGGGGGGAVPARPAPEAGLGAGTGTAWYYRLPAITRYRITRIDSLTMGAGLAARPQVTAKVAEVTARTTSGGSRITVSLDSVRGGPGSRLSAAAIDSVRRLVWEAPASRRGPSGGFRGSVHSVLAEQLGQAVGLLFQQLPQNGVRPGDEWSDSEEVPVRLDAFDARETANRRVRSGGSGAGAGLTLEVEAALSRKGTALQRGQEMKLEGSGKRVASYRLGPAGWPTHMTSRDSLSLSVRLADGTIVPVRWITRLLIENHEPGR